MQRCYLLYTVLYQCSTDYLSIYLSTDPSIVGLFVFHFYRAYIHRNQLVGLLLKQKQTHQIIFLHNSWVGWGVFSCKHMCTRVYMSYTLAFDDCVCVCSCGFGWVCTRACLCVVSHSYFDVLYVLKCNVL